MTRRVPATFAVPLLLLLVLVVAPGCGMISASGSDVLTVYSGRTEQLVGPLLDRFKKESGIKMAVKYAGTPELANAILEEGDNTPADVFFSQDAGSLGALAAEGRLEKLDQSLLDKVEPRFRSDDDLWVGTSARSRVVAFNPARIDESELPASVLDFTDPKWKGRVGWAPTNASFESFVTALRVLRGEEVARNWLVGMKNNRAAAYPNNITIVQAVSRGEIDIGLVNHYYLYELKAQDPNLRAVNHFLRGGDPGALLNVAGVGILAGTKKEQEAKRFAEFLLSKEAQEYFANTTFEYPVADGVPPVAGLAPLETLDPPQIDLSNLADLRGTQKLLTDVGIL
jgi:iron(III) transport system substrate-binding protein